MVRAQRHAHALLSNKFVSPYILPVKLTQALSWMRILHVCRQPVGAQLTKEGLPVHDEVHPSKGNATANHEPPCGPVGHSLILSNPDLIFDIRLWGPSAR